MGGTSPCKVQAYTMLTTEEIQALDAIFERAIAMSDEEDDGEQ